MNVTGNRLYELIQLWQSRKNALETEFTDSLMAFEGQVKRSPAKIDVELVDAEVAIMTLQLAQKQFNQTVKVRSGGTLDYAIKRLGVLKRAMKRWENVTDSSGLGVRLYERNKESDYAKACVEPQELKNKIEIYTRSVLSIRSEIGDANATSVDLEIPDKLRE